MASILDFSEFHRVLYDHTVVSGTQLQTPLLVFVVAITVSLQNITTTDMRHAKITLSISVKRED